MLRFIALFILYLATAKLGLLFDAVGGFASLIWPPSGIAFAFLLIYGPRFALAVFLAAFAANYSTGASLFTAVGIGIGNMLEPLVGTYLFRRFTKERISFSRVTDVLAFVLIAIFSAAISATVGTLSLQFSGAIEDFIKAWPAWWLGDLNSILILVPFILIWRTRFNFPKLAAQRIEAFILTVLIIFITTMVFTQTGFIYWRPYWCHLLLIWATLRFNQHAATFFMIIITLIAVWATTMGLGPFQLTSLSQSLLYLQLFLFSLALTALFFGAINKEREVALQARSDFVSIASHELKTPLTVLDIQMQIIKQTNLDPEARVALKNMDFHLQRLNKLVATLLDLSQLESGKIPMIKGEMNLTELMKSVASHFGEYLKREKCTLELDLDDSVFVQGNQYRLEQVITNLLMNAIKYGTGKPLRMTLKHIENKILISIEDQGMGIEPEHLERIFERFERVNSSKNLQGLGLGLFIAKEIVLAHEGRIWAESEVGKGSIFWVELPSA